MRFIKTLATATTRALLALVIVNSAVFSKAAGPLDQWQPRNAGASNYITALTFDSTAGRFVAVDDRHAIENSEEPSALLLSADGVTWSRQTTGTNRLLTSSLAAGQGLYISPKYSPFALPAGPLLRSANGVDWVDRTPESSFVKSVKFVNGQLAMAGGRVGDIIICDFPPCPQSMISLWFSISSIEIELTVPPRGPSLWNDTLNLARADFAYGNGVWVVLGWVFWGDPFALSLREVQLLSWSSTDGTNFSRGPVMRSGFFNSTANPDLFRVSVVFGDGRFVVVSRNNILLTSVDGTSWQSIVGSTEDGFNDVAFGGGQFVAVGTRGAIISSTDGIEWTPRNSGTGVEFRAVEFGHHSFLAVGGTNAVFQSQPVVELKLSYDAGPRLDISAPLLTSCRIEATANPGDALSWTPLATVVVSSDPFAWTDPEPSASGPRFYRTVILE